LRRASADRPQGPALDLREHPHRRRLPAPAPERVRLGQEPGPGRVVPGAGLGAQARPAGLDEAVRLERASAAQPWCIGALGATVTRPPGRAARPDAASSVAPVASGYEHSLRPCLGTIIAARQRAPFRRALLTS